MGVRQNISVSSALVGSNGTVFLSWRGLKQRLVTELGSTKFAYLFVLRPMIPLARGVAILDDFTGRTQLETEGISVLLTAIGSQWVDASPLDIMVLQFNVVTLSMYY